MSSKDIGKGFVLGVAFSVLAPLIASAFSGASRPLRRALARSGLVPDEKAREAAAEISKARSERELPPAQAKAVISAEGTSSISTEPH